MKSILVLATTAAVAVSHMGCAGADFNVRQVSSTSTDTPTPPTTSAFATSTGSDSSVSVSSTPTVSSSPFANITSAGTLTQTLGGVRPSTTISGSLTQSVSSSTPNAAATPAKIGAGLLAGVLGVVAIL
ncbi:hypothetical protein GGS26DRAFT_544649 [Hypomontagnella submonticulosa]|nr:hypothetical protein GGS26DRAFT_544649 [Hypomontagnella submonticulosa]